MLKKLLYSQQVRLFVFATCLVVAAFGGAYWGMRSWKPPLAGFNNQPAQARSTEKPQNQEQAVSWWGWTTQDPAGFYTFVLDILTGLVFIAGAFLSVYTYRLWRAGESQIRLTRRATFANLHAAKAAQKSAAVAERALIHLERPYVFFKVRETGMEVDPSSGAVHAKGMLVFSFVNRGRTPAILVEHNGGVAFCRSGQFPDPPKPDALEQPRWARMTNFPAGIIIAPNKQWGMEENIIRLTLEDGDAWFQFAESDGNMFLVGYLRYADVIGARHILGYCAMYDHIRDRFVLMGGETLNYSRTEQEAPVTA